MDTLAIVLIAACIGGLAGAMLSTALAVKSRSEIRRLDADMDDLYERVERAQKRRASRERRENEAEEEQQQSLPGVADPQLKQRIRAAWLNRRKA